MISVLHYFFIIRFYKKIFVDYLVSSLDTTPGAYKMVKYPLFNQKQEKNDIEKK